MHQVPTALTTLISVQCMELHTWEIRLAAAACRLFTISGFCWFFARLFRGWRG